MRPIQFLPALVQFENTAKNVGSERNSPLNYVYQHSVIGKAIYLYKNVISSLQNFTRSIRC